MKRQATSLRVFRRWSGTVSPTSLKFAAKETSRVFSSSSGDPKTTGDYIRNILEAQPTNFGMVHPLRRQQSASGLPRTGQIGKLDQTPISPKGEPPEPGDDSNVDSSYLLHVPVWTKEEIDHVLSLDLKAMHKKPITLADKWAYFSFVSLKHAMNLACGFYTGHKMGLHSFGEAGFMRRVTFLETIAGVPGFVAAMARHCIAMREMKRDNGWIHTLLEEAENERMHLLVLLEYSQPGRVFKGLAFASQFVMLTLWGTLYFCSPRLFHRFVGYFEEGAVLSYREMLAEIDAGKLPGFFGPAKPMGKAYWSMPEDATVRDVIAQICADEYHHRLVNHTFADMTIKAEETGERQRNPFSPTREGDVDRAGK